MPGTVLGWLGRRYLVLIVAVAAVVVGAVLRQFSLETPTLPLGRVVEAVTDWLIINLSGVLLAIKLVVAKVFVFLERVFLWFPWPVWAVVVGFVGWRVVSRSAGFLVGGGMVLIQLMGLWAEAMSTLALVATAMILNIAVAIPVGIAASRSDRLEAVLRPLLDAMQTIPSFVYLIPAIMLFGVGRVPAVFATMVFAVPPAIRLTNLGLRQVSADIKEAAMAFGATRWQLLVKVEMPLALRTIMAGINQSTMMSVSMVVIAAFIGAGGLGYSVLFALDRVRIGQGFEAGLAILVVAIVLDRLTQAMGRIGQRIPRTTV